MKLASYKGTRSGYRGLFNRAVRFWFDSPYSHTEIVFSDGMWGSSEGWLGVRLKKIEPDEAKWDFKPLYGFEEEVVRARFESKIGCKFDYLGLFGQVWMRGIHSVERLFCSEVCVYSLGFEEPHKWNPDSTPKAIEVSNRVFLASGSGTR